MSIKFHQVPVEMAIPSQFRRSRIADPSQDEVPSSKEIHNFLKSFFTKIDWIDVRF